MFRKSIRVLSVIFLFVSILAAATHSFPLLFINFLELAASVLSFAAFFFTLNSSRRLKDSSVFALSTPFLFIGLTQVLYMPQITELAGIRTAQILWCAGRSVQAIVFSALALSLYGKKRQAFLLLCWGIPLFLLSIALPAEIVYNSNSSTSFVVWNSGFTAMHTLVLATFGVLLIAHRPSFERVRKVRSKGKQHRAIIRSVLQVLVAGGLSEMAYFGPTDSLLFLSGLLFQILSQWYMLKALLMIGYFVPYERLIRNLTFFRESEQRARKRAEKKAGELEALRANMNDILLEHEPDRLFSSILNRAVSLLAVSGGELALFDKEKNEIVVAASTLNGSAIGSRIAPGEGVIGMILQTREPVVLHGYGMGNARLPEYQRENWYNLMAVPLCAGDKLTGALVVFEQNPIREFLRSDVHLLKVFAQQASLAIVNVQLLNDARHKAEIDSLTGLFNHGHFFDLAANEVNRALRYHHALSVIMFDIDHFKKVNDTFGHAAGDVVLAEVAGLCSQIFRKVDIVGRYGGEEFAVMLPETEEDLAFQAADRLRRTVFMHAMNIGGSSISVTISLGVATLSRRCSSLKQLLARADKALYRAKNRGRNQCQIWVNTAAGGSTGKRRLANNRNNGIKRFIPPATSAAGTGAP